MKTRFKILVTVVTCLAIAAPGAQAASLTRKQRWAMRAVGLGLVGFGLVARGNENENKHKADQVLNDFYASNSNRQSTGFLNAQFKAVAEQSEYQRTANAWSIGKNASWGLAGLLFTVSFIPNSWARPTENGRGVMVGYELKVGKDREK